MQFRIAIVLTLIVCRSLSAMIVFSTDGHYKFVHRLQEFLKLNNIGSEIIELKNTTLLKVKIPHKIRKIYLAFSLQKSVKFNNEVYGLIPITLVTGVHLKKKKIVLKKLNSFNSDSAKGVFYINNQGMIEGYSCIIVPPDGTRMGIIFKAATHLLQSWKQFATKINVEP